MFDYAAQVSPSTPLVLTDALADIPDDRAVFDLCAALAVRRGAAFISVRLECGEAENLRRLTAPGRADRLKLTKTDVLSMLRAQYRLLRPDSGIRIDLDVTAMSSEQAADALHGDCRRHLRSEH